MRYCWSDSCYQSGAAGVYDQPLEEVDLVVVASLVAGDKLLAKDLLPSAVHS